MILRFLKTLFVGLVFISFGIIGYFIYRQDLRIKNLEKKEGLVLSDVETLVTEKIENIKFPVASPSTTTIIQKVAAPASTAKPKSQPTEFIIPMGTGTITETGKWIDIYGAQATINTDNYPGLKTAYFEVVMHIPNAQGEMQAKLVETTLPFYYGEILRTQSGTGVTLSAPVFLKSGNRNYRVQLNNQIGTGVLDYARIRIVTE